MLMMYTQRACHALLAALLVLAGPAVRAEEATILDDMDTTDGWTTTGSLSLTDAHATGGNSALRIRLGGGGGSWTAQLGRADVSRFDRLKLDVYLEGSESFLVHTDFTDAHGKTYRVWYTRLRPGFQVMEWSVAGIASEIDAKQIVKAVIAIDGELSRPTTLYLDRLRGTTGVDDDSWVLSTDSSTRPSEEVPGNVMQNGGFEAGMQGWGFWGEFDGGKYIAAVARNQDARSGRIACGMLCQSPGRGGMWQALPDLEPGEYTFRYWVKGSEAGTRYFHTFEGEGVRHMSGDLVKGSTSQAKTAPTGWEKVEGTITVTALARKVRLYLYATGTGTLLFDDVVLVPRNGVAATGPVSEVPQKPRVVAIRDRQVLVDGKPFFMIGMYRGEPSALADTGFNFITGVQGLKGMDEAYQAGLMTWTDLQGVARLLVPEAAPSAVKQYQNHPAVLTHQLADEPDHKMHYVPPAVLRVMTAMLREADPNHPTSVVVMPWAKSNVYQYANATSILMSDPYSYSVARVVQQMDELRAAAPDKPVWAVLRAGWDREREPTADYIVATAYAALACDLDGVMWFEFSYCKAHPAVWEPIKQVSLELKALLPILTLPKSTAVVTSTGGDQLRFILKEHEGKRYLIAVNTGTEPLSQVQLSVVDLTGQGQAQVKFEDRTVPVQDGTIVDDFEVNQRHVYVF